MSWLVHLATRITTCLRQRGVAALTLLMVCGWALAARGERPAAFERRCIPPGCVAPPSNIPDILGRHALPAGRLAVLGAAPDFHHGPLRAPSPRPRRLSVVSHSLR